MSKPFFSVIIPTFNRRHVLSRAIDSVLNQSFKDFELIIVDDGSSDETQTYLDTIKDLQVFKTIKPEEPSGVSVARNVGVANANANWICFLDSDDEWMTQKLEKQYRWIKENPGARLVYGQERWVRNSKRVNKMNKHTKGGGDLFERSIELCLIGCSTVCLEKSLINELGGFREDFPVCEDYDLWLKVTSLYKVGFIEDELIIKYGGHKDQLSRKFKAMDYYRIKSMNWILKNRTLTPVRRELILTSMKTKCEILLKGYEKHNNLDNYAEVLYILENSVGV